MATGSYTIWETTKICAGTDIFKTNTCIDIDRMKNTHFAKQLYQTKAKQSNEENKNQSSLS